MSFNELTKKKEEPKTFTSEPVNISFDGFLANILRPEDRQAICEHLVIGVRKAGINKLDISVQSHNISTRDYKKMLELKRKRVPKHGN